MQRQNGMCACGCGRDIRYRFHVDHRKAIANGGRHARDNLQLMAPICNLRKGKKDG
jgi:5-methylcytosine-specific restriction endonuclease McrA